MQEPTFRQHQVLTEVAEQISVRKIGNEDNIETYWELVRSGYLVNFALLGSKYDWRFKVTQKGLDYLESIQ